MKNSNNNTFKPKFSELFMRVNYNPQYGPNREIGLTLNPQEVMGILERADAPCENIRVTSKSNSAGLLTRVSVLKTNDPVLEVPVASLDTVMRRKFTRRPGIGYRRATTDLRSVNPAIVSYSLNVLIPIHWGYKEDKKKKNRIPIKSGNRKGNSPRKTKEFSDFSGHHVLLMVDES